MNNREKKLSSDRMNKRTVSAPQEPRNHNATQTRRGNKRKRKKIHTANEQREITRQQQQKKKTSSKFNAKWQTMFDCIPFCPLAYSNGTFSFFSCFSCFVPFTLLVFARHPCAGRIRKCTLSIRLPLKQFSYVFRVLHDAIAVYVLFYFSLSLFLPFSSRLFSDVETLNCIFPSVCNC